MTSPSEPASARRFALWYVRVLGALLVLQAAGGAVAKLTEGRVEDLPHNLLHLASGILALWASSPRATDSEAPRFAVVFGGFYAALGVLGYLGTSGTGALQLELADHVFHAAVGVTSLVVGLATRPTGAGVGDQLRTPR